MTTKKKPQEQKIDKRILERMIRDGKMKESDVKAYIKKRPDISNLAEEMNVEKELSKSRR
ncbi:MAG: hypothetical protein ABSB79_08975 [Syntrophales bacterium]|jgi:hypothetical protein